MAGQVIRNATGKALKDNMYQFESYSSAPYRSPQEKILDRQESEKMVLRANTAEVFVLLNKELCYL